MCARTDLKAPALLEVPCGSVIEGQRQHVPGRQLDHTLCRYSHYAGIAHQHDEESAEDTQTTQRALSQGYDQGTLSWELSYLQLALVFQLEHFTLLLNAILREARERAGFGLVGPT